MCRSRRNRRGGRISTAANEITLEYFRSDRMRVRTSNIRKGHTTYVALVPCQGTFYDSNKKNELYKFFNVFVCAMNGNLMERLKFRARIRSVKFVRMQIVCST